MAQLEVFGSEDGGLTPELHRFPVFLSECFLEYYNICFSVAIYCTALPPQTIIVTAPTNH